jgi:hypothetical protein
MPVAAFPGEFEFAATAFAADVAVLSLASPFSMADARDDDEPSGLEEASRPRFVLPEALFL